MAATFEFPSFQFSWDTMLAEELANAALQLLPIWFFGALVGLLVSCKAFAARMDAQ
jgi:hypothetical protein